MRKSKLSLGLVASFIGALALTACDDSTSAVTKSKHDIVNFTGYNSKTEKLGIDVDELYRIYGQSKEGTSLYYNAILETLIRYEYPLISDPSSSCYDPDLKSYSRINSEVNDKIKAIKQTAKDNAKANDTSYAEEWDKILEQNDVDSTKELKLKYIYELEKEAITDWYFKKHSESTDTEVGLREGYIGLDENWEQTRVSTANVDPVYPYHILHILVKLDADATNYTQATISEAEAKKLWQVVQQLIDGQFTFEETAKLSDDTSKDEFGDVGLMTTHTEFYNEFKLGIYAFDGLLSGVNTQTNDNKEIYEAFGIDSESEVVTESKANAQGQLVENKEYVTDLVESEMVDRVNTHIARVTPTIPTVPFDVFRLIGEKAEEEKIGTFEPEGSAASLPRNVLFNAFLNFRSPFVITNERIDQDSVSFGNDDVTTEIEDFKSDDSVIKLKSNNFQAGRVAGLPSGVKVLCDKTEKQNGDPDGNVIIGVRSSAGIHFMIMRKSVFKATNVEVGKDSTTLEDYYTTKVPGDEGWEELKDKDTFVNMKDSRDLDYYTQRSDKIKNDIKSSSTFDAAYDYRLYETLLGIELDTGKTVEESIHFPDEDPETHESVIKNNIENMIDLLRESHHYSQIDSINDAWESYLLQLIYQNNLRNGDIDDTMFKKAFVPTTCAFTFDKDHKDQWKEEGGKCYVK